MKMSAILKIFRGFFFDFSLHSDLGIQEIPPMEEATRKENTGFS